MTAATRLSVAGERPANVCRVELSVLGICFAGLVFSNPWSVVFKAYSAEIIQLL